MQDTMGLSFPFCLCSFTDEGQVWKEGGSSLQDHSELFNLQDLLTPHTPVPADEAPRAAVTNDQKLGAASFNSWGLQMLLGVWSQHSNLCLHVASPLCVSVSSLFPLRTLIIRFKTHPNSG